MRTMVRIVNGVELAAARFDTPRVTMDHRGRVVGPTLRDCPKKGDDDGGSVQRPSRRTRRGPFPARSPRRCGHRPARRRPCSMRRQRWRLVIRGGWNDVGGHAQARRELPPRRNRRRRERHHRRPDDHHQARPGPARGELGDARQLRRPVQADGRWGERRSGAGADPGQPRHSGRSCCARGSSSTTARRSRPPTSSTRCSASSMPRRACSAAAGLASIDANNIQIMDPQTVRLHLTAGDSTIGEQLGQYYNGIVPVGYNRTGPLKWVGTGPYITKSFTPGQQSVAHPQRRTTGAPASRTSTRSRSSTSPTRPRRSTRSYRARSTRSRTSRSRRSTWPSRTAAWRSWSQTAAAGCRCAWPSTCRPSPTTASARRCA